MLVVKDLISKTPRRLAWILIVGSALGLLASFVLTMEKMALLENPAHRLSCSLNPVLSCGPIIASPESTAFGFPNPFLGLAGFSVVMTVGVALLAGASFKRWFWRGLQAGTIFGILFVHWLIFQSLYEIGALCLYCMLVWSITAPIFWYTTLHNLKEGHLPTPKPLKGIVAFSQRHHLDILISWYVLVVALIIIRFWYYWKTLI
jgi:uncharacterized membrane protein